MKTVMFIDGRNFIGKLKEVFKSEGVSHDDVSEYQWSSYNFQALIDKVLTGIKVDEKHIYLGKLKVHPDTVDKSKILIEEQRLLKTHLEKQGFVVYIAGSVRGNYAASGHGKKALVFKEKGVDVSIAVDLVTMACDHLISAFILASSDSDMQPAVRAAKTRGTTGIYLGFELNPNKGLTASNDRTILIRNSEVMACKVNTTPALPL